MSFTIEPVRNRSDLRRFIFLPEKIHRHHKLWAPPIYGDEWRYFDARRNRSFTYSDTILAVARRDRQPVGRIMGIINRRVNEKLNEKTARFGYLETYEDETICHRLLNFVEDWARARGMNKLVGPMGFTDQDAEGFLIEGFDEVPTLATYYNFPFMIRYLESAGYTKEIDYVDYTIVVPPELPKLYQRVLSRLAGQTEFTLREFTRKKELKPFIRPVLTVLNETFTNLYGYSPLDELEMDELAAQYLPLLDPRLVKVVTRDDEVIGFVVGMPNLSDGIRKARGRLYPFGIFIILNAMKQSRQLDLLLGGIKEPYRGRGIDVMLGASMMRSAIAGGFKIVDSHHEMETNFKVRAEMEHVGGKITKRLRIFRKPL